MKHIFGLLLALFTTSYLSAQNQPQQAARTARAMGYVEDSSNGMALPYASVSFWSLRDSVFQGGTITDEKGNFEIELSPGRFQMKIDYLGYQSLTTQAMVRPPKVDLGVFSMKVDESNRLDEVQIEAERSTMTITMEKKVFEVGQDMASIGGSAVEVLENVPSVTVDPDGGIQLRGASGVRILIDGKQSGLVGISSEDALALIPSDQIVRVEVITNPSARYDAEGTAGIINIITKKGSRPGTNLVFNGSLGYPLAGNASLSANYNKGPWELGAGYTFRKRTNLGFNEQRRETYAGDTTQFLNQYEDRERGGISHGVNLGAGYTFNRFNRIDVTGNYRQSDGNNLSILSYSLLDNEEVEMLESVRTNTETEDQVNTDLAFNYTKTYRKKDKKWTVDMNYSFSDELEDMSSEQDVSDPSAIVPDSFILQRTLNNEVMSNWVMQTDMVNPINDSTGVEYGAKASWRVIDTDFNVKQFEENGEFWYDLVDFTNQFRYEERIYAAYFSYDKQLGKWGVMAGLRGEYSDVTTTLATADSSNAREYFNLFPTIHTSYKLNQTNSLQLSYSRRIRRPGFWHLNPFFSYQNPTSFRSGNPNLDPQYTDALELSHLLYSKKGSLSSSIYYRYTQSPFQYIQRIDDGVVFTMPENANSEQNYGLEVNANYSVYKWWRLMLTYNYFGGVLDATNLEGGRQQDYTSSTVQLNSTMKFDGLFDLQVRGNYRAPRATAQGTREAMRFMDISATKNFANRKASVSFKVSDVFNTRYREYESFGDDFYIYNKGQWRQRNYTLGFTYRLHAEERDSRRRPGGSFGGGMEE